MGLILLKYKKPDTPNEGMPGFVCLKETSSETLSPE